MPTLIGTPGELYDGGGDSSATLAYNVAATGERRALRVWVGAWNGGGGSITGVTYAGVAMTQVGSTVGSMAGAGVALQFILVNPATGSNNIVVSGSGNLSEIMLVASAWSDVNQTGPTSGPQTATGTSAGPSLALTVTGDDVGIAGVEYFSDSNNAVTESDTLLHEQHATSTQTGYSDQYGDGTLGWTFGASATYAACGFTLVHDAGGGGGAVINISAIIQNYRNMRVM